MRFKWRTFMITATIAASSARAAPQTEPVRIPSFTDIPHASHYASAAEYDAAVADRRLTIRRVSYQSDGLTVYAYVYGPRAPKKSEPVIIFNRGSWTWPNGFVGEILPMARRLAEKGYVVVAPLYRGSGGAAGKDEMGGADLDDLMNLQPVLAELPGADPSRIYLYGESRGGMMVYQALRDGFPARAAAVVGGFADMEAMLADPQWGKASEAIWPDLARNRAEIVRRRSAVQWPERITAPILIIHGAADSLVSPTQSLKMAGELLALGRPFQLLIVENGDHTISRRAADRDAWVTDWFARHP